MGRGSFCRGASTSEVDAAHTDKFMARVMPEPNSGCWIWTGRIHDHGYGMFSNPVVSQDYRAHRWSYLRFKGDIPKGTEIDHVCRVRCCVNPDHLEAVTRSVNVRRGTSAERTSLIKKTATHCAKGHLWTPENTRIITKKYRPTGTQRWCRECAKARSKKSNLKRALAKRAAQNGQ